MRTLASALLLSVALTGIAAASSPIPFSPRSGEANIIPDDRDLCWDEPGDLSGVKVSSEIIAAYALESEVANDFIFDSDACLDCAAFMGGYFTWMPGDPEITGCNWKFYGDLGCTPDDTPRRLATMPSRRSSGGRPQVP